MPVPRQPQPCVLSMTKALTDRRASAQSPLNRRAPIRQEVSLHAEPSPVAPGGLTLQKTRMLPLRSCTSLYSRLFSSVVTLYFSAIPCMLATCTGNPLMSCTGRRHMVLSPGKCQQSQHMWPLSAYVEAHHNTVSIAPHEWTHKILLITKWQKVLSCQNKLTAAFMNLLMQACTSKLLIEIRWALQMGCPWVYLS